MKEFFNKLERVKIEDFVSLFKFILALPIALLYKLSNFVKKEELWLICEDKNEARDNGYVLFKYIRENYPYRKVFYAINKKSIDYKKVEKYQNIIEFGGFIHWIYYLAATKNISSHKGGKPNAAVCYFLEVYGIYKNKRVFLQHGVTLSNAKWLYYKNTKMRLFICGAYHEYLYVKNKFGYPDGYVKYLGFPRFDKLHNVIPDKNTIVFMPTWRNWIASPTKKSFLYDDVSDFTKTEYFIKCNELINHDQIISFLESNNIKMYFFPHRNMQKFLKHFETKSKNIIIANSNEYDIQDLLKISSLMITDYSSVSIDFSYMKKPVIYYQFDQEKFRKGQYAEGYFNYEEDGFGPVCYELDNVYSELEKSFNNNFRMQNLYKKSHSDFFKLYDKNNCERNYEAIKNI